MTPLLDANGNIVGSKVIWMLNVDVAGSLPDLVKKGIGKAQCGGLESIINYCKKITRLEISHSLWSTFIQLNLNFHS